MRRKINHLLTPAIKTGMTPGKKSRLESAYSIVKYFGTKMPSIISQVVIDPIRMKARQTWIDEAERIAAVSLFSAIESLDEHEDECEKKLTAAVIAELQGKPKKLEVSKNPKD
jgi:hypothetical protein